MRLNQLDTLTMARLLEELCAAHGKPFGSAAEKQIKVYHEALHDCSVDEVTQAVKTACRDFDRFPKPHALRTLIMGRRPRRVLPVGDDPSDRCRECGTGYIWRRLPHWIEGYADLQCDCGWRMILKGYATEDDLAEMHNDPLATDELRRRANLGRAA